MWNSGSYGNPGGYALMQDDGNLVVHRADGTAAWSTGTWGHAGAWLQLQPDGSVQIYARNSDGSPRILWSSFTGNSGYPDGDRLLSGAVLLPGRWRASASVWLLLQSDGNLTLYRKSDGAPIWQTGTQGRPFTYLGMQPDGNLVLYLDGRAPGQSVPLWYSGTWGNAGAHLKVQDDANLVVYRPDGTPLWASGTWGRG